MDTDDSLLFFFFWWGWAWMTGMNKLAKLWYEPWREIWGERAEHQSFRNSVESGSCWCLADNISQKSLLGLNIPNFTGCHSCHSTLPLAPFYLKIAECTIPTRIIISIFLHRAVNLRLPFGRKSRGHARPSMEDMYMMMHACMHPHVSTYRIRVVTNGYAPRPGEQRKAQVNPHVRAPIGKIWSFQQPLLLSGSAR